MHFVNDNGRPAVRMTSHDEFGKPQTVIHVIDLDCAYCLQSELAQVLAEIRREKTAAPEIHAIKDHPLHWTEHHRMTRNLKDL